MGWLRVIFPPVCAGGVLSYFHNSFRAKYGQNKQTQPGCQSLFLSFIFLYFSWHQIRKVSICCKKQQAWELVESLLQPCFPEGRSNVHIEPHCTSSLLLSPQCLLCIYWPQTALRYGGNISNVIVHHCQLQSFGVSQLLRQNKTHEDTICLIDSLDFNFISLSVIIVVLCCKSSAPFLLQRCIFTFS